MNASHTYTEVNSCSELLLTHTHTLQIFISFLYLFKEFSHIHQTDILTPDFTVSFCGKQHMVQVNK